MMTFNLGMTLALLLGSVSAQDGWQNGRTTWFDVENDDLRTANCHLDWSAIRTGRDVAAFSDRNPLFSSSCGMCLEIKCQPATFTDGYGQLMNRNNACFGGQSVFVTLADACPCEYPNNAGSNRRWCCGDDPSRQHVDITRGAFSRLADLNQGVIGIQWRQVDCSQVNTGGNSYPVASGPAPQQQAPAGGGGGPAPRGPVIGGFLARLFGRG